MTTGSTGTTGTTGADRLQELVEIWHGCAADVIVLLRELPDDAWQQPTDLPGWDVRAVGAHLAHLESELAGNPQQQVEVPEASHIHGLMGQFTEGGTIARAGWTSDEIVDELERSVATRYAALTGDPPGDPDAPGPGFAGLIGWSWQTLLTNRPFDVWMHEQDIRRATDRPGNLDSRGAEHALDVFSRSLSYVLGKLVRAPAGTSLVVEITPPGHDVDGAARLLAVEIGEDGRGRLVEPPTAPSVRLRMDVETFVVLSGGRRSPEQVTVEAEGDEELAARVLAAMAVTP